MTTEALTLVYDGPALVNHEIDVEDLAASLLALSGALKAAQQEAAPGSEPLTLKAHATRAGSFEVDLLAQVPSLFDGLLATLGGRESTAAANASGILALAGSAWAVIKWMRGRTASQAPDESGDVTITTADGDTLTVPEDVAKTLNDVTFRKHTERIMEPLKRDGVTSMAIHETTKSEVILTVTKAEIAHFEAPLHDVVPEPVVERSTVLLTPLSIDFDWRKWRVSDGVSPFSVTVEDEDFRDQVDRGAIRLSGNDLLKVRLRTVQSANRSGTITTNSFVERVTDYYRGGDQQRIHFPPGDDN